MTALSNKELTRLIKEKSKDLGFFTCGISNAEYLKEDSEKLRSWLTRGLNAEMTYMANHFEKRTDPSQLLNDAVSVISVLYNYYPENKLHEENNYKISKYAYGRDYHFILKRKLKELIKYIDSLTENEIIARAFVDSAPVLERSLAAKSGLGWIGKNTCLITKEQGSFFFIGEIILDVPLVIDVNKIPDHCGGCMRCIHACPTEALKPYELDSNKCISYWTIEHKGENIPAQLNGKFDDWIFGCDICQNVCPWNKLSEPHNEPEFLLQKDLRKFKKVDWEKIDQEKFNNLFKGSAVKRTKYKGLIRNIYFNKISG